LFNLVEDISETTDVHAKHPEVVMELTKLLEDYRSDLRDNARPVGHVREFRASGD
jgi:hypothetical protein